MCLVAKLDDNALKLSRAITMTLVVSLLPYGIDKCVEDGVGANSFRPALAEGSTS